MLANDSLLLIYPLPSVLCAHVVIDIAILIVHAYPIHVGGLEQDKHPILTFPEVGLKHLDSPNSFKELNTTLLYLKSLMRLVSFPQNHPPPPSLTKYGV